jgi:hypothetical protein
MSKLLINENPMVFQPSLAKAIGINEAIVLQQIQYWLNIKKEMGDQKIDGKYWIYNTYDEWELQFKYMSARTIMRTIKNLCNLNLVIVQQFDKRKWDRKNYYTINYEELEKLEENCTKNTNCDGDNLSQTDDDNLSPSRECQSVTFFNTETTTKTTTENTKSVPKKNITVEKKKEILNLWLEYNERYGDLFIKHRTLPKIENKFISIPIEEIREALDNYYKAYSDDRYWVKYKYHKGLPRFLQNLDTWIKPDWNSLENKNSKQAPDTSHLNFGR